MADWIFATPPTTPRSPEVVLVAFGQGPLQGDAELSAEKLGAPKAALEGCTLRTIERRMDPRWFDAWRSGSLRTIAETDLGSDLSLLDAADHAHVIVTSPTAPADLTYLQAAWALARYVISRGASLVLDAHAMTYIPARSVQSAGDALDIKREVRVVYETSSTRDDGAHALHTRGMRKFGAPDLIALCTDSDARFVGHAISELADSVARGTELALPRHALRVAPGVTWMAVEDEHRVADILQLNNEARVLVDLDGKNLMGVLGRLPRVN
jgi:hypothetical protein